VPQLSVERIKAALTVLQGQIQAVKTPFSIEVFDEVSSTNRCLWERAKAGAPSGTVSISARQTAGRGQRRRAWQSETGGLYLSLYLDGRENLAPTVLARNSPQLTLCSAWGIVSMLRDRSIPVLLKWPNDLILQRRKLGGILTETRVQSDRLSQVVIGVGINWGNPTPEVGVNLQQFWGNHPEMTPFSLEMLAALVLVGLDRGVSRWQNQGIEALLPDYQRWLVNLNQSIEFEGMAGTIVGVAANGNLIIRTTLGTRVQLPPGRVRLGYEASPESRSNESAMTNR